MTNVNEPRAEKRKKIEKILVFAVILVGLVMIWYIKNYDNSKDQAVAEKESSEFALHVTGKIDLEKLKSYGLPIIIDFGADSCAPCKEMAPVLEELNETLRGKAIIKFVDVWKYQDLAEGYPVRVIPTQVLFDNEGKPYVPEAGSSLQMQMYSSRDTEEHVFTTHEGGLTKSQLLEILKEMGMK